MDLHSWKSISRSVIPPVARCRDYTFRHPLAHQLRLHSVRWRPLAPSMPPQCVLPPTLQDHHCDPPWLRKAEKQKNRALTLYTQIQLEKRKKRKNEKQNNSNWNCGSRHSLEKQKNRNTQLNRQSSSCTIMSDQKKRKYEKPTNIQRSS